MHVFVVRHSYPWNDGDDMIQVFDSFEAVMKKLELTNLCRWDSGETIKIEYEEVLDEATMSERLESVRKTKSRCNHD
jgi:ribosomal protein L14E/L6E/L27E